MTVRVHFHLNQRAEAERLVMSFHYSRRIPSNIQVIGSWHQDGGLFGDTGPMVAACFFTVPGTRWGEDLWELARLVRVEGVELPPLSGLVSAIVRWIAKSKAIDLLVSYADSAQGHHGGVYQACSWRFNGKTARRMDGVMHGGRLIAGRTANHIWGSRSPTKLGDRGIEVEAHYDEGKYLYWKALNRAGEAKATRLGLTALPYPKPDPASGAGDFLLANPPFVPKSP